MAKIRVAVLMGGTSAEREISLSTGRQIIAALDSTKYTPQAIDAAAIAASVPATPRATAERSPNGGDAKLVPLGIADLVQQGLGTSRPDVVFIALHGRGGEDGTVQGMLELLGIPYTGSGVLASALAMDKAMTKRLLRAEGIMVPDDVLIRSGEGGDPMRTVEDRLVYPVIVKPNREGSTIGCTIVQNSDDLLPAVRDALQHDTEALIEAYLAGIEITAGLLGNRDPQVLPLIEIVAKCGLYDYEAKYAPGGSAHIIPARIPDAAAEKARDYARRTHEVLGCRGMSRVDMIVVGDEPYVLETNTIPGMTPTSLLPEAARAAGIEFPEMLDRIIGYATEVRR